MKVEVEASDLMAVLGPALSFAEHELECDTPAHRYAAKELQQSCHRCAQAVAKKLLDDPPPEMVAFLRRVMGHDEPAVDPVPPAGEAARNPTDPRGDTPTPLPVAKMNRAQLEVEADRLGVPHPERMNIANLREYVEAARHRGGSR